MKNKSQQFPKQFENIQFPISHLEAENPFGLVLYRISGAKRDFNAANFFKLEMTASWTEGF